MIFSSHVGPINFSTDDKLEQRPNEGNNWGLSVKHSEDDTSGGQNRSEEWYEKLCLEIVETPYKKKAHEAIDQRRGLSNVAWRW